MRWLAFLLARPLPGRRQGWGTTHRKRVNRAGGSDDFCNAANLVLPNMPILWSLAQ
jgi:hypothetical protein